MGIAGLIYEITVNRDKKMNFIYTKCQCAVIRKEAPPLNFQNFQYNPLLRVISCLSLLCIY